MTKLVTASVCAHSVATFCIFLTHRVATLRRMTSEAPLGLPSTTYPTVSNFAPISLVPISSGYRVYSKTVVLEAVTSVSSTTYGFGPDYPYLIFGRSPLVAHHFLGHDSIAPEHAVIYWSDRSSGAKVYLQNLPSPSGVKHLCAADPSQRVPQLLEAGADVLLSPGDSVWMGQAPVQFRFRLKVDGEPVVYPPPVRRKPAVAAVAEAIPVSIDGPPPAMPSPPPPPPR